MTERRFESRFLCADLVRVDWQAGDGSGVMSRTVEAVLEDISPMGACVQVEDRIPLGASISISAVSTPRDASHPALFTGCVSYCVFRDYGYFVGIRFSNESRWSSGVFEPQHLTNLEALLTSKDH